MAQKSIEFILFRQLSNYLSMAVFIVDQNGALIFYNEAAESILGSRFSETGEMPAEVWSTIFVPRDLHGEPIPPEKLPLTIAFAERRPAHDTFYVRSSQGKDRPIEVSCLPIINSSGNFLGAVAFFLEKTQ